MSNNWNFCSNKYCLFNLVQIVKYWDPFSVIHNKCVLRLILTYEFLSWWCLTKNISFILQLMGLYKYCDELPLWTKISGRLLRSEFWLASVFWCCYYWEVGSFPLLLESSNISTTASPTFSNMCWNFIFTLLTIFRWLFRWVDFVI